MNIVASRSGGVLNGILSNFEICEDRKDRLFEHLILQLILSESKNQDKDIRVSHPRTSAGAEVDFVLDVGESAQKFDDDVVAYPWKQGLQSIFGSF